MRVRIATQPVLPNSFPITEEVIAVFKVSKSLFKNLTYSKRCKIMLQNGTNFLF